MPIPSSRKGFANIPMLKQVCIIPFRREYLLKFNETEETELEKIIESHGFQVFKKKERKTDKHGTVSNILYVKNQ